MSFQMLVVVFCIVSILQDSTLTNIYLQINLSLLEPRSSEAGSKKKEKGVS